MRAVLFIRMRFVRAMVIVGMGGLLSSCSDFVSNAMELNGSRSWNVPLQLEGTWAGQPIPTMGYLVSCLQKDSMTEAEIPQLSVLIKDGKATGALVMHDGVRFDLVGETFAGAWHTGDNLVMGKTFFKGRKTGDFSMEPDGFSGRLKVNIWPFDRSDTRSLCGFSDVVMTRKS